jgi:hypothetical protein
MRPKSDEEWKKWARRHDVRIRSIVRQAQEAAHQMMLELAKEQSTWRRLR